MVCTQQVFFDLTKKFTGKKSSWFENLTIKLGYFPRPFIDI